MLRTLTRRLTSGPEPLAPKVPEITALFWVIKLLTTGIGEATSDFLGGVNVGLAGLVGITAFVYGLKYQLRSPEYRAVPYWSAVLAVAIFGTMAADAIHVGGLPYAITTPFYALVVAAVFYFWHRSEGTLSIHSITTRRREVFYWTAVLATFALGTAAGDLTAISLNLGYFGSAVLFAIVIAVPAVAWRLQLNPIVAFWAAYVVTRPLGASVADGFAKTRHSGLGVGDGVVTLIGLVAFAALVAYTARAKRDIQPALAVPHESRLSHFADDLAGRPQPAEG
jgi:uncharacterized membrane-anchored protein